MTNTITMMDDINKMTKDQQYEALRMNGLRLGEMKKPTGLHQQIAVSRNPYAVQFVDQPDEPMQLRAVLGDPRAIEVIKSPTIKTQVAAVIGNGLTLGLIKKPHKITQIAAVLHDHENAERIEHLCEAAHLEVMRFGPDLKAIKHKTRSLHLMNPPTERMRMIREALDDGHCERAEEMADMIDAENENERLEAARLVKMLYHRRGEYVHG